MYAAMVKQLDNAVGILLQQLKDQNQLDNTIILFTSDNGGLATHEGMPTANAPLRGGKGWCYEGGTRVPLIAVVPGSSKPAFPHRPTLYLHGPIRNAPRRLRLNGRTKERRNKPTPSNGKEKNSPKETSTGTTPTTATKAAPPSPPSAPATINSSSSTTPATRSELYDLSN